MGTESRLALDGLWLPFMQACSQWERERIRVLVNGIDSSLSGQCVCVCVCVFRGPRHSGSLCGSCPCADSPFQLLLTTQLLLPGPIILATPLGWLFTALFKAQWINAYFHSSSPAAETIKALDVACKGAIWFGKDCEHSPPPNTRKHTRALMSNFYLIPSLFLACLSIVQTCLTLAFEACEKPI